MEVHKNRWLISWKIPLKWMMTGGSPILGNLHMVTILHQDQVRPVWRVRSSEAVGGDASALCLLLRSMSLRSLRIKCSTCSRSAEVPSTLTFSITLYHLVSSNFQFADCLFAKHVSSDNVFFFTGLVINSKLSSSGSMTQAFSLGERLGGDLQALKVSEP